MHDDPVVTFGAAGLDRAAHLRADAAAQKRLLADGAARCAAIWRGKPLFDGDSAAFLPADHPVFDGLPAPAFLGLVHGAPVFAHDLSAWEPEGEDGGTGSSFIDHTEYHHPLLDGRLRFAELLGVMAHLAPVDAELIASAKALFAWHDTHGFCARCGAPSQRIQAGWQRECTACGAAHFPRTDPVVIMLITRGNRVLVGRSPGWPDGMYSLLAGFMEPGETLEAAVRREVREEAAVEVGRVRYLASQPWPFPSSLMLGCSGEAVSETITLDPAELEEALWLTREEMAAVFSGLHPKVRPPRRGAIAEYLLRGWLGGRWR